MKFVRILTVILTFSLCVSIFFLSSETAAESSATSRGLIAKFVSVFVEDFYELPKSEQNALCAPFQFIVRKSAHFCAYLLLGVLSFLSVATYSKPRLTWKFSISAVFCLLYAISDEIHQYFVPGRSCELRDICIDFGGTLVGLGLVFIILKISKKGKLKSKEVQRLKKKDLIEKTQSLFMRNEELNAKCEKLQKENEQLKSEITSLSNEINKLKEEEQEKENIVIENEIIQSVLSPLEPDREYGAKIIGEIVVDATLKCNSLALEGDTSDRELVNLILGRTEVSKAEILKIVSSDLSFDDKKLRIDNEKNDACDYFISVLAQKN